MNLPATSAAGPPGATAVPLRSRVARALRLGALALTLLSVGTAPLLVGSVHLAAVIGHAAVQGVALLLVAVGAWLRGRSVHVPRLGYVWLAAAGLSLLQLVPLPAGLVRAIAPGVAEPSFALADALLQPPPGWLPLSLSPRDTLGAVLAVGALAAATIVIATVARNARRLRVALAVPVAAGLAVVAVGLLHVFARSDAILFWYAPERPLGATLFPTTFVNPNHFAGLMTLLGPLALGWARSLRSHGRREALFAAFLACTGGVLASLSRGGIAAYAVGVGLVLWLPVAAPGDEPRPQRSRVRRALFAAGVALGLLALLVALDQVFLGRRLHDAFGNERLADKVLGFGQVLRLIGDHPFTGIGRGAFADVFQAYAPVDSLTFSHAENVLLQAAADWGLPATLGLLCLFGWALRPLLKRAGQSSLLVAALIGALALLAQNLVDFGLYTLGVALPFVAVLAVVDAAAIPTTARRRVPPPVGLALGLGLVAAAWASFVSSWPAGELGLGHTRVRAALPATVAARVLAEPELPRGLAPGGGLLGSAALASVQHARAAAQLVEGTAGELASHPADGRRLSEVALQAFALEQWSLANRLLGRATARTSDPGPALFAARAALRLGDHAVALRRYRLLYLRRPELALDDLSNLPAARPLVARLTAADRWLVLGLADAWLQRRAAAPAVRLLRAAVARSPFDRVLLERLGAAALAAKDWDAAARAATALLAIPEAETAGWLLEAEVDAGRGNLERARVLLSEAVRQRPSDTALRLRSIDVCLELGRLDDAERQLAALGAPAGSPIPLRLGRHLRLIRLAEARNDLPAALRELEAAIILQPRTASLRLKAAELHLKTGNTLDAERHLRQALQLGVARTALPPALQELLAEAAVPNDTLLLGPP